jgi:hypothetical protein
MPNQPTEDVPYEVDPFAVEDQADTPEEAEGLSPESALVKDIRQYLKEAEAEHNTLDLIDLTEAAKMTPTQQIAVHKLVVQHLRNIKEVINNKVKEY